MSKTTLVRETLGSVAVLTLNRPRQGNSLDIDLSRQLMEQAIACNCDPEIRAVILKAEGKFFCAGGDVPFFAEAGENLPHVLLEETALLHAAITRLARMQKPLITAIQGFAAGAGFSLAMLGDIVLASRSAQFTLAYTGIGLTPDGGATWLLPRLVGLRRTQAMILLNPRLSAEQALTEGLVTEVVEDDLLYERANAIARELAAGPSTAFGRVRELLLTSLNETLETHLEREAREISASAATKDGREGISAFLEKRTADFVGR